MPFENPSLNPKQLTGSRSAEDLLAWLEEFRRAHQVTQWFLRTMTGAGDGVMGYGSDADDIGKVKASTVPNMTLKLRPFAGFVADVPFRVPDELVTPAQTAPSADDRIDAVVARALPGLEGEFVIIAGDEDAAPVAPSITANDVLLAWIHHRPGETSIKDADDATNGYIEDKRTFLNM